MRETSSPAPIVGGEVSRFTFRATPRIRDDSCFSLCDPASLRETLLFQFTDVAGAASGVRYAAGAVGHRSATGQRSQNGRRAVQVARP